MRLTGTHIREILPKRTVTTFKDDMKRTSSDSSLRNYPLSTYPQLNSYHTDNGTQPQIFQRTPQDRSNLFPLTITGNIIPPRLTNELYEQLIVPLVDMDFEKALCIAGVNNLIALLLLTGQFNKTLLHVAAEKGDTRLIKVLLMICC